MAQLNRTELARYLHTPHSYLAMTRRSPYVDDHRHKGQEGQDGTGATMRIVGRKYLFVYPFVKTHEWYQHSQEERQQLMNEHFVIGHKYPDVKISTSYSFGLDDQEFVLGFETDSPRHFPGPGDGPALLEGPPLHGAGHADFYLFGKAGAGVFG